MSRCNCGCEGAEIINLLLIIIGIMIFLPAVVMYYSLKTTIRFLKDVKRQKLEKRNNKNE